MLAIIDYGVGNLFSLTASLEHLGIQVQVTGDREELLAADRIILPGVGAFEDAMGKLQDTGLVEVLLEKIRRGTPLLGICLGMQLLFEESLEYGRHKGLGLIKGTIAPMGDDLEAAKIDGLKVPHIGWNALDFQKDEPLFRYVKQGDCVYYVHSFYGKNCEESTIATSDYGIQITGAVRSGKVYGTQFHPEKSGDVGLNILRAFMEV